MAKRKAAAMNLADAIRQPADKVVFGVMSEAIGIIGSVTTDFAFKQGQVVNTERYKEEGFDSRKFKTQKAYFKALADSHPRGITESTIKTQTTTAVKLIQAGVGQERFASVFHVIHNASLAKLLGKCISEGREDQVEQILKSAEANTDPAQLKEDVSEIRDEHFPKDAEKEAVKEKEDELRILTTMRSQVSQYLDYIEGLKEQDTNDAAIIERMALVVETAKQLPLFISETEQVTEAIEA